jgi:hypothetical protein
MKERTVISTRAVYALNRSACAIALRCSAASALFLAALVPSIASAQVRIDVELNQTAQDAGLTDADVADPVNEIIASELKLDGLTGFLDSMAKAQAMSNKGMGADYASNIKKFEVGGSVSSALNGAGFSFKKGRETLPQGGFAAHVTLMGGINLGLLASKKNAFSKRFRLYGNGLYMPLPGGDAFGGTMYNVGAHLQVKIIRGADAKITEWGGIDITSGFEYAGYQLNLKRDLPLDAPIEGGEVTWTASGDYGLSATATSIPIEVSTNVRVAIMTGYLGGAVDIYTGESALKANLSGPIKGTVKPTLKNERLGDATLALDAAGVPDAYVPRVFAGGQLAIGPLKGYGHLNVGFNQTYGGHLGGRLAW